MNDLNIHHQYKNKSALSLNIKPVGAFAIAMLFILPLVPPFNQEYMLRWLITAVFAGACAVAFDFTGGYINIINFGFSAFIGLGGYTSALISIHTGISPWIAMVFGAVSSALLGLIAGVSTLRLRGLFAACLTWFIGLSLMGVAIKWVGLTRGQLGLRCPALIDTISNIPYYYTILIMALFTFFVMRYITKSYMGLAFKAIGQNMDAAKVSGVKPVKYRLINFIVSCAFAGWFGGFYAHYYKILTPDLLHTTKTIEILVIAYIGGRGSLWGGLFVAIPFVFAMELMRSTLSDIPGLNLIIYSLFLILIMIYYPGGFYHFYLEHIENSKNKYLKIITSSKLTSIYSKLSKVSE